MAITVETLLQVAKSIQKAPRIPRIFYTPHALQETTIRLFPASRHRSARVRKKLIKRHGSEFRMMPCMYYVGDDLYAHPALKTMVEAQIARALVAS